MIPSSTIVKEIVAQSKEACEQRHQQDSCWRLSGLEEQRSTAHEATATSRHEGCSPGIASAMVNTS